MFDLGVRHPRRNMLVCLDVTLVAWASVAWGAFEMGEADQEALGPHLMVGLGLVPAILAPAFALNFWRGVKVFAAIRRGENAIGRWTVSAAELAEFSPNNGRHNALLGENVNVWTPPRAPPPAGLEIIFVADGVLVGDTYFALVTAGIFRIIGVRMLAESPRAIAFRTVMVWGNRFGTRTTIDTLRIPVAGAAGAEAAGVLRHYERVLAGETIVDQGLYRRRKLAARIGLAGAPICLAVAALGLALKLNGRYSDGDDISGLMIILGTLSGGFMLVVGLIARSLSRTQLRKH